MKILIRALAKSPGNKWQVSLDGDAFTFRNEAEALPLPTPCRRVSRPPPLSPQLQQRSAAG
ncbi:hypothetical protein D0N73_26590 [Pseudomonas fluorescens]|nr:hypothetical protein D0N73_26590 [Pseudomonas fluorescens]